MIFVRYTNVSITYYIDLSIDMIEIDFDNRLGPYFHVEEIVITNSFKFYSMLKNTSNSTA